MTNDKVREALEFYADPFKWKKDNNSDIQIPDFYSETCFGDMAAEALASDPWQPIETAPKDQAILVWCDHKADEYVEDKVIGRLTTYAAHCEGMGHANDGYNIVEWGGGYDDRSYDEPNGANMPDWWFVIDSDFERPANPTHWQPLPNPPERI